jgi:hypothetical protein
MKRAAQLISCLALAATLLPGLLFFADRLELPVVKSWMLAAAVVWFLAAPLWMEHKATD